MEEYQEKGKVIIYFLVYQNQYIFGHLNRKLEGCRTKFIAVYKSLIHWLSIGFHITCRYLWRKHLAFPSVFFLLFNHILKTRGTWNFHVSKHHQFNNWKHTRVFKQPRHWNTTAKSLHTGWQVDAEDRRTQLKHSLPYEISSQCINIMHTETISIGY